MPHHNVLVAVFAGGCLSFLESARQASTSSHGRRYDTIASRPPRQSRAPARFPPCARALSGRSRIDSTMAVLSVRTVSCLPCAAAIARLRCLNSQQCACALVRAPPLLSAHSCISRLSAPLHVPRRCALLVITCHGGRPGRAYDVIYWLVTAARRCEVSAVLPVPPVPRRTWPCM